MSSYHPESLQALLDSFPFYALVIDDQHRIAAANPLFHQTFGSAGRPVVGQCCQWIVHGVAGDFPGCPLAEVLASGQPVEREVHDPRYGAWILSSIFPLALCSEDGRPLYLHFARDITETKRIAQERDQHAEQQNALVSLMGRLQACDTEAEVLRATLDEVTALSWLGLRTSACGFRLQGETLELVAQQNLAPPLLQRCARIPLGYCLCGRVASSGELLQRAGVEEAHEISYEGMAEHGHAIVPLRFQSRVLGVLNFYLPPGKVLDGHQRSFLEAAAAAAAAAVEHLRLQATMILQDRLANMGLLAAGVAHEINNPLTYLLANLQLLGSEDVQQSGDIPSLVAECLEGACRIRVIVGDLKTFSRVEGKEMRPLHLNAVIESAMHIARSEIKYRARLVEAYGDIGLVLGNSGQLGQVFLNLLINAAQAIDEGDLEGNAIHVRTWEEGGEVRVEVRDSGRGIPPEALEQIFEPFFTTKPAGVGTGLGLAICRTIVTSHGGDLRVTSEVGKGSRFELRLPLAPQDLR